MTPKSIASVGDCQTRAIYQRLSAVLGDEITYHNILFLKSDDVRQDEVVKAHDLFLCQPKSQDVLRRALRQHGKTASVVLYPKLVFSGFHPDLMPRIVGAPQTPMGPYHSAIVAAAWLQGMSAKETIKLFCEKVFRHLGYFDHWNEAKRLLLKEAAAAGMPLQEEFDIWLQRGVFMYDSVHAKYFVLDDLARRVAIAAGLERRPAEAVVVDEALASNHVFPAYPEIAAAQGAEGGYVFRYRPPLAPGAHKRVQNVFGLEEFVEGCFEAYAGAGWRNASVERLSDPRYRELASLIHSGRPAPGREGSPYAGLPDHHFWRRSVADVAPADLDPVTRTKFKIDPATKIATAGSCFAQHIARTLQGSGYRYFVAEEGIGPNYGVFSARYGNLYTTRQLLQLFDRAYGDFVPIDTAWRRADGRFVDPFRPEIEPEGFASAADVAASREQHLAAVRRMFEELDVFVFTLGLTEGWAAQADGAVFPLPPGSVAASQRASDYRFVNFRVAEVVSDLDAFLLRLRGVNPRARMILTVSPVPLTATYEDRHVLVSTTYSKSVLRVAAEECASAHDWVEYFPSYEIITGQFSRGAYFAENLRSITDAGVAHVMRIFLRHYADRETGADRKTAAAQQETGADGASGRRATSLAEREFAAGIELVCEEELLDQS